MMSLDPNVLLEMYSRDISFSPLEFGKLRDRRSEYLEELLVGGCDESHPSAQQRLRYYEFAAKAYGFEGLEPASSIPAFLASQQIPAVSGLRDDLGHLLPRVVRTILGKVDLDYVADHGRHGPGVVAGGLSRYDKWLETIPPTDLGDLMDPIRRLDRAPLSNVCSVYYDVPKNAWTKRGICAEPPHLQFAQQGIGALIKRRLFGFTDLSDQKPNQEACLFPGWNTIDLSSASDTISVAHCDDLFSESEDWYALLMEHRASWCRVNKEIVELQSVASMGNGFCFPLLTLVIVAIICSVLSKRFRVDPRNRRGLMALFRLHARVYGDDIVLSDSVDLHVRYALECFGFRINAAKSSFGGRLRESCGTFALDGVVVRDIVRIRDCSLSDPNSLVHVAGISRRLYSKGFSHTAAYLRRCLHSVADVPDIEFGSPHGDLSSALVTYATSSSTSLKWKVQRSSSYHVLPCLTSESRESDLGYTAWGVTLFGGRLKRLTPEVVKNGILRNRPVYVGAPTVG